MSVNIAIPEIVLASTSPRRQMLLRQINLPFRVIPPDCGEYILQNENFPRIVIVNAEAKASSVLSRAGGLPVLGADTLIELDGEPLGKPVDVEDARRMLSRLSGREHLVHTGISLMDADSGFSLTDNAVTRVYFRNLTEVEINDYIASGEPMDKAGSYGIQERGAVFIHRVEGCFFNVIGLPIAKVWEMLMKWLNDKDG